MVRYDLLYHIMVDGAERALEALERGAPEEARRLLIAAERAAEELYIAQADEAAD